MTATEPTARPAPPSFEQLAHLHGLPRCCWTTVARWAMVGASLVAAADVLDALLHDYSLAGWFRIALFSAVWTVAVGAGALPKHWRAAQHPPGWWRDWTRVWRRYELLRAAVLVIALVGTLWVAYWLGNWAV